LNTDRRRSDTIYAVIQQIAEDRPEFRPGDIADFLRDKGQPMGVWEIRAELSRLEAKGLLSNDANTGNWSLSTEASRKTG